MKYYQHKKDYVKNIYKLLYNLWNISAQYTTSSWLVC